MPDLVVEVTDIDFKDKVLDSQKPAFVYFWVPWSGPCQSMGPVISDMALQFGDRMVFANCRLDSHPDMAKQFEIVSTPTVIIFNHGNPAHSYHGSSLPNNRCGKH